MAKRETNQDISIIITAHSEGLVSHKTMLSVLAAADKLTDNNISYEIIISLDNPDKITSEYYSRYKNDKRFTIKTWSYGNVAESRNSAIELARGKYVALLDGDDMVSSNWYLDAYKLAEKKKELSVFHQCLQIQFGVNEENNLIWVMADSFNKEKDAVIMVQFNRWMSSLFAKKEVFSDIKYKKPVNGYGYEDYCFNADTLAQDIKHYVVPKTIFFYRRMASGGKQDEHINEHTLLPYTDLFDFDYAKTWQIDGKPLVEKVSLSKKIAKLFYVSYSVVRQFPSVRKKVAKRTGWFRKLSYEKKLAVIPEWVIDEWKRINRIDNELWPTVDAVRKLNFHPRSFDQDGADATRVGVKYVKLCRQFTKKPDYIFFTYDPLGAGGTEKVLVNYINSLKKIHPDWHFAVMRKKPDIFPFAVPSDVDFVDFYGETDGMDEFERDILLDRIIVQSEAKRLHCFFNGWAHGDPIFRWVNNHKKFLRLNDYKVYVSWFMKEFVPQSEAGRIMTFADPYLGEIDSCVTKVLTDNQAVIDDTLENCAYDPDKFKVHHQPMQVNQFSEPKQIDNSKPLKVLWASRLSYQKRPDILRKIAEKLNPDEIKIDIYGREQNYKGDYFDGIDAADYKGEFSGFNSLPLDNYDVFLYTSQVDGMPNVLLEATVVGLPIIASNDGGVSELIKDKKTGRLIELENIDGYIEALKDIRKNPDQAKRYVTAAQKIVKNSYTQKQFDDAVKRDIE